MKRAQRKLSENGEVDGQARAAAPGEGEAGPKAGASSSEAESVESMLQEFGRRGTADGPRARPQPGTYDQLWQLSMADPHTGLVNQLLLLDRLGQALVRRRRHGGQVVVCRVDLENLAEINTSLGYALGNDVLCEAARRLTSALREEDTIGRVAGSEIVVAVTVTNQLAVGPLLRRIQHTLDRAITVDGHEVRLRAALGAAVAEDDESAEDVLSRAGRSTRVSRH